MTTDIQNLKSFDPFAEADDSGGQTQTSQQNYIHIRIQRKCTTSPSLLCAFYPMMPSLCPFPSPVNSLQADVNPAQSAMVARP